MWVDWIKKMLHGSPAADPGTQARALFDAGETDRARMICLDILRDHPGSLTALRLLADVAFVRGSREGDVARVRAGIALNPGDSELPYLYGRLLEAEDDLPGAAAAYRNALKLDPGRAKAHNNLGCVLQNMGQTKAALDCFHRAIASDPGLWQAHFNLGNYHKLHGRLEDAIGPYQNAVRLQRTPGPASAEAASLFDKTCRPKLVHEIEQLNYLADQGVLPEQHRAAIGALQQVLQRLEPDFARQYIVSMPADLPAEAAQLYNRLVYMRDTPALAGPAVNPNQDFAAVEADYFRNAPGLTYLDDFLTPDALDGLRRYCLESTLWFDFHYTNGYLGANLEQGFGCPLLVQIADELRRALPGIFGEHRITHLWAYKYDSQLSGINVHADFAAVNVNFWLTPDEANLSPESGGLVVWNKEAPLDWDFATFNRDIPRIERFLRDSGAEATAIPHKQNRVVMFNSDLFHKTDDFVFRPGFENRRINVTMLYGDRQMAGNSKV